MLYTSLLFFCGGGYMQVTIQFAVVAFYTAPHHSLTPPRQKDGGKIQWKKRDLGWDKDTVIKGEKNKPSRLKKHRVKIIVICFPSANNVQPCLGKQGFSTCSDCSGKHFHNKSPPSPSISSAFFTVQNIPLDSSVQLPWWCPFPTSFPPLCLLGFFSGWEESLDAVPAPLSNG